MANTNKGRRFYISTTAQNSDLDASGFAALSWTEVKHIGNITEMGTTTAMVSYDELGTEVTQKNKGVSDAGNPTIECARVYNDAGQVAMRAAALTRHNYAFKITDDDVPSGGSTPTIYYNRGVVNGPTRPGGRVADFILEVFTLGLNQREVVVNPT